ncbi:MAG TPA: sulfate adenylyltransferase subunit CysN [Pseudomonadota bacterium]|nr:sulfate adenylyltransferase subunit CysN [Pseudomonadota bacterium]HNN54311.1 sulfate adenylyltransferase subunit CysN [Pseudomonadota bacterium]HNO66943.1 sulfate adenylyltransferase subunit CysN [Pseudomonadota bacterium]
MSHKSSLIAESIEAYLNAHQHKGLLRFMTCGSVDDGKSTLIGRLLYESKLIFSDQLAALEAESRKRNVPPGELDLSLLVDGLAAEREQGITIDVAYRFFSTDRRKFIVADSPGHEQYTRNMVTAASNVELAILLVDARKGVLTQTRRHSYLVSLLGIQKVVLAVNKMDAVDFSEEVFLAIAKDYLAFAQQIGLSDVLAIPLSALKGDNVTSLSERTPYFRGPTLMEYLETVTVEENLSHKPLRMPVQWVNRPHQDFRGFSGLIASGTVRPGDRVRVMPKGVVTEVKGITTYDGDLPSAVAGQSVTLTLRDEVDVSRGDILVDAASPPGVTDQFQATVVWMHETELLPGRPYLIKLGTSFATATVSALKYKVNVNTLEKLAARTLSQSEIGVCNLSLDRALAFDSYADNRDTGGFILIDRMTNNTVGAGLIHFALRRADNIHWQAIDLNKEARALQKGQKPCVLWFTGLSGSGKSTIANLVDKQLYAQGRHSYILDGDNVRHGLCKDLGFSPSDRVENIRRVAEVAKLMVDSGLIVLVAFISPFRAERQLARSLFAEGEFLEIFVDTPLAEAERRDPKGLYKKARAQQLKNFTGIDSPYEAPESPEIRIDTTTVSAEDAAAQIVYRLG